MVHLPITFRVNYITQPGQTVYVVGRAPELGSWDPSQAPALTWSEGGNWIGVVFLQADHRAKTVEYKYCIRHEWNESVIWEDCENRRVVFSLADGPVVCDDVWGVWQESFGEALTVSPPIVTCPDLPNLPESEKEPDEALGDGDQLPFMFGKDDRDSDSISVGSSCSDWSLGSILELSDEEWDSDHSGSASSSSSSTQPVRVYIRNRTNEEAAVTLQPAHDPVGEVFSIPADSSMSFPRSVSDESLIVTAVLANFDRSRRVYDLSKCRSLQIVLERRGKRSRLQQRSKQRDEFGVWHNTSTARIPISASAPALASKLHMSQQTALRPILC
eukprot:Rmarinus@m.2422